MRNRFAVDSRSYLVMSLKAAAVPSGGVAAIHTRIGLSTGTTNPNLSAGCERNSSACYLSRQLCVSCSFILLNIAIDGQTLLWFTLVVGNVLSVQPTLEGGLAVTRMVSSRKNNVVVTKSRLGTQFAVLDLRGLGMQCYSMLTNRSNSA